MIKLLSSAAALFLLVQPAVAAADTGGDNQARLICKRTAETGSRMSSARVCRTAAQWKAHAKKRERDIENVDGDVNLRSNVEVPTMDGGPIQLPSPGSPR